MTIEENVRTTKAVAEFIELGESICSDQGIDVRRFWLAVHVASGDRAGITNEEWEPQKVMIPPFDDEEAEAFGRGRIEYGKHNGTRFDDLPLDYLGWLSEQADKSISLRRYYESRRVQAEVV